MSIDCSFVVCSFRSLDAARKASKKNGGDLLTALGPSAVKVGWRDDFAESFLAVVARTLLDLDDDDDSWRGEPIEAPGYVLHALDEEFVEALKDLDDDERGEVLECARELGDVAQALALVEELCARAGDRANLYLCTHLP